MFKLNYTEDIKSLLVNGVATSAFQSADYSMLNSYAEVIVKLWEPEASYIK